MQPLKTTCDELTNTTQTNPNNEVSKTLFASVVKSKKVLELREPTLKTKENIEIKKEIFKKMLKTNFVATEKPRTTLVNKTVTSTKTIKTKLKQNNTKNRKSEAHQPHGYLSTTSTESESTQFVKKSSSKKIVKKSTKLSTVDKKKKSLTSIKKNNKQKIKVNKKDIACKIHGLHHFDLQMKEKHDIMFYTNDGECLYNKKCDGCCDRKVKDMLSSKKNLILVCQNCLLSATTDDDGCTAKEVFVICDECRQQQFDVVNTRKRRRCQKY